MTDNEIIKALRCMAHLNHCPVTPCGNNCPYWSDDYAPVGECVDRLCADAANLIERVQVQSEQRYLTTNMPTITAQLRDADSGVKISTLAFKLDGASVAYNAAGMTCTPVTGGYNISYTPQTALSDGPHSLTVAVTDNDGNVSATASRSFTIDTVAPVLNVTTPADGLITNQTAGMVAGTTSDATSSPVTLTITVNGSSAGAVTVDGDGNFSKAITYAEGSNTVVITATDSAGKATSVTRTVVVDTVPPEFVSVTLTPNPVDAGQTYILSVSLS